MFTVSEKNSRNSRAEMIKRQSLCSLLQLTHHSCWSNKDFLISFLPHLWPTWPELLSLKSLLHPYQIPSSNGEDAFCDTVGEIQVSSVREGSGPIPFVGLVDDALAFEKHLEGARTLTLIPFFSGTQSVGGCTHSTSQLVEDGWITELQNGRDWKGSLGII